MCRSIRFAPKHAGNTPAKNQPRNPARIWHCDIIIFVLKTSWRWRNGPRLGGLVGEDVSLTVWSADLLQFTAREVLIASDLIFFPRAFCMHALHVLGICACGAGFHTETRPSFLMQITPIIHALCLCAQTMHAHACFACTCALHAACKCVLAGLKRAGAYRVAGARRRQIGALPKRCLLTPLSGIGNRLAKGPTFGRIPPPGGSVFHYL